MFGLFDDLLQESLALLQGDDLGFVVGHGSRQPQALVSERSRGWMRHHHRAQRLLVELHTHTQLMMMRRRRKSAPGTSLYLSYQLMQVVL